MTHQEKIVLNDIVNGLENLTVSLDALEGVLIRAGLLTNGAKEALQPLYVQAAVNDLAALRAAIASLPEQR